MGSEAGTGIVYLVGAGPGDPGLLTLRGREVLAGADVVVYDHLISPRLLDMASRSAERIYAGKSSGRRAMSQKSINALLVERARAGRSVVRLKGGDPFVFGRGGEEALALQAAAVPFRVVPGVTSGVGATAYAGIPVTHRGVASAVAFVTGHDTPGAACSLIDWSAIGRFPGTLLVFMGAGRLSAICETLICEGRGAEEPAAFVQSGSTVHQRTAIGTLADLPARVAKAGLGSPALLIVGDVVGLRKGLTWFERLPLFGSRIVLTRPAEDADRSASDLEALGAEVLLAPMVVIRPLDDFRPLNEAIERLSEYDWLVFTSSNGVRHFLDRLQARGHDLRALGRLKLAAIGPTTASALGEARLNADVVPEEFRSEGLAAALRDQVIGKRVLLARADRGRTVLQEELSQLAVVDQVAVYRNVDADALPQSVMERIEAGSVDWITLTSSAVTRRLFELLPPVSRARIGGSIKLVSISPVTTATAESLGWCVAAEASAYTWAGLITTLVGFEARNQAWTSQSD